VNVETRQIVALEVTKEYVHDGTRLERLVEDKGIEPIIKVRRNAVKGLRDAHSYKIGYRFNVKVVDGEV